MIEKRVNIPENEMIELVDMLKMVEPEIGFSGYTLDIAIASYFNKNYSCELKYKEVPPNMRFLDASQTYVSKNHKDIVSVREIIDELIETKILVSDIIMAETLEGKQAKRRVIKINRGLDGNK